MRAHTSFTVPAAHSESNAGDAIVTLEVYDHDFGDEGHGRTGVLLGMIELGDEEGLLSVAKPLPVNGPFPEGEAPVEALFHVFPLLSKGAGGDNTSAPKKAKQLGAVTGSITVAVTLPPELLPESVSVLELSGPNPARTELLTLHIWGAAHLPIPPQAVVFVKVYQDGKLLATSRRDTIISIPPGELRRRRSSSGIRKDQFDTPVGDVNPQDLGQHTEEVNFKHDSGKTFSVQLSSAVNGKASRSPVHVMVYTDSPVGGIENIVGTLEVDLTSEKAIAQIASSRIDHSGWRRLSSQGSTLVISDGETRSGEEVGSIHISATSVSMEAWGGPVMNGGARRSHAKSLRTLQSVEDTARMIGTNRYQSSDFYNPQSRQSPCQISMTLHS